MSIGTMTLHRFNGDEIDSLESATIEHYKNEDGSYAVIFDAKADKPIQTLADTEPLRAQPFGEWTLILPKIPALLLRAGSSFTIPNGYSETMQDYVTNLYYCEHEPMEENEIVVIERDGLRVRTRIIGMATDVNYYDGSKPRTRVVVEADFTLSP
jgi:hypothetical protein